MVALMKKQRQFIKGSIGTKNMHGEWIIINKELDEIPPRKNKYLESLTKHH